MSITTTYVRLFAYDGSSTKDLYQQYPAIAVPRVGEFVYHGDATREVCKVEWDFLGYDYTDLENRTYVDVYLDYKVS